MRGGDDRAIQDWFIESAFPSEEDTDVVLDALARSSDGLTISELEMLVDLRRGKLRSMLKILEAEGAVDVEGWRWFRSASPWTYPAERIAAVTAVRRCEQRAMEEYLETDECLMKFLREQLDDDAATECGRCANCLGIKFSPEVAPDLVEAALQQWRSEVIEIPPRSRTPKGLSDELDLEEHNLALGRALTRWGDPGLAQQVRTGKYEVGEFSDELVDAMAEMVESWALDDPPAWVTSVPSRHRSELVSGFAARVAKRLGLPYVSVVSRNRWTPSQKDMENSYHKARNALRAFDVAAARPGPVLLVDDVVDSRWTLTVVAAKLRQAGSGPVYAVALADASVRGG